MSPSFRAGTTMENERRGIRWLARTRRVVRRVVRYMVGSGDSVAVWQCGSVAAVAPVVIVIVNSNSNRNSSDSGSMTAVSTPTVNLARRRGFIRIPRPGCYDLIEWGSRDTPSPNPATMMAANLLLLSPSPGLQLQPRHSLPSPLALCGLGAA